MMGGMRIQQLKSLTQAELEMLSYIVNVISPVEFDPPREISIHDMLFIKHDVLLNKITTAEPKVTPEGMEIYKSLLAKIKKTWFEEVTEEMQKNKEVSNETPNETTVPPIAVSNTINELTEEPTEEPVKESGPDEAVK